MNSICASIILFNPEIARLEENIKSIIDQISFLILIDNNSNNIKEITKLVSKFSGYKKIYLFCFYKNKGIACALNRACVEAHNRGV